jgi:diadenosine tetraphosphate (Ap4A) HIT family hydrolase
MQAESCFLCRKHNGDEASPPGGYIYEDDSWMVCHAPADKGPLGTLFIESRRHVLDFAEFDPAETASFGVIARRVYAALRHLTGAERIYQVSMMEGIAHFHSWIVPRQKETAERGVAFLAKNLSCTDAEAAELAVRLRELAREW